MTINNNPKNKRILIIDDNPQIHRDFQKILLIGKETEADLDKLEEALLGKSEKQQYESYVVDCAFQGEEGLKLVEKSLKKNEPYSVAFIDVRMPPGWDGIKTISRIWEIYPNLQIVICTAYSDYSWKDIVERFGYSDQLFILKKPFDNIEVRQLASALSEKWKLTRIADLKISELGRNVEERTRELSRTKSQLETVLDTAPIHIASIDLSGKYASWNKASEQMFGYKADEVIGKLTPRKFHRNAKEAKAVIDIAMKKGIFNSEVILVRRDGSEFPAQLLVTKMIDSSGSHIGFTMLAIDITERQRVEEALRQSEAKYRYLIENAHDVIYIVDIEGKFVEVNEAFLQESGYVEEDVIGRNFSFMLHPDDASIAFEAFEKGKRGDPCEFEMRVKKKDDIGWYSFINRPIYGSHGAVIAIYGIARDITERKRAEEALKQAKIELEKWNLQLEEKVEERSQALQAAQDQLLRSERLAIIGQLAGSVSHELRNALGVLQNSAYFLNLNLADADGKVKKHLITIKKEISRSDKIISNLFDFSRTRKPDYAPTNFNQVIEEALSKVVIPERVLVKKKLDKISTVMADGEQLQSVFINLISNGIQAMPKRGTLRVKMSQNDRFVEVKISDTGVGISKENLKKIFEPLFTTKSTGMGLGLCLSQKFIENHGGTIKVESKPNKGSTFIVRLPINRRKK